MSRWVLISCYVVLLGIGLAFIAHGLLIPAKATLAQYLLESAWQKTRKAKKTAKPWPWADIWPIARLTIDGKSTLVLADGGGESLAFGPSHVSGSARPGTKGTSVISAHRDTHFQVLKRVKPGSVVTLERADGVTRDYEVRETRVLSKPKLLFPPEDGRDRLILVTCWPFDAIVPDTQKRFSVLGERIR
jgi:sortase A